jgi:uncharacterized protein YdeI (YjbR/CyaY-like superfamily)
MPADREAIFFASSQEWRAWLETHHADAPELLVGFHKKATDRPSLTWPESVDQALCFGWIDGVRRSQGPDAYTIRFTPRRSGSHWSAVNVARATELIEAGLMTPAGLAAFASRDPDRTARAAYERSTPAELTADEEAGFRADVAAWAWFEAQPAGYRRTALHWVDGAKRPETRARRIGILIACSASGEKIPPLRR